VTWYYWLPASLAIMTATLMTAFVVIMHAEEVIAEHGWKGVTPLWRGYFACVLVVGWPADALFNATIGSLMFWELPQWFYKRKTTRVDSKTVERWEWYGELMFSKRCSRHKSWHHGNKWRHRLAVWCCEQLDQIDLGGHC